MQTKKLLKIHC